MKAIQYSIYALCILLLITSCQKKSTKTEVLNGIWQSVCSGWILHIQDSTRYTLYDNTSVSCLTNRKAELSELKASLSIKKDTLKLRRGIMTYAFVRSETMPKLCNQVLTDDQRNDPLYNFEVFAETVKAHYAFMELNTINWSVIYAKQKRKLSLNPTDIELYNILEETLELLNDNHGFLEASEAFYERLEAFEEDEDEVDSDENNLPEYGDFQVADMVAKHHMVEDLTKDSWLIKWGKMENNIGFIQIKAMWLYADLEIPEALIEKYGYVDAYVKTFHTMYEGDYIKKEIEGVNNIMDNVMRDLKDTQSIVIDVRFNGGGQDAVNFEILKRFNDQRRHVANIKLKDGNGYTSEVKVNLDAGVEPYTKPVYMVTSQQSGSATESFAINSMAIPHIKRIGSRTQGALSTALEKTLPNGWAFAISNEVGMDAQGNSYENIGVPVDIIIDYPEDRQTFFRSVVNNLQADKQAILKAIKH